MNTTAKLQAASEDILAMYREWLHNNRLDLDALDDLHRRATVAMHNHYCAGVPIYRRLATELDLIDSTDADTIRRELASTDELFKSYAASWLDDGDFTAMTQWIEQISNFSRPTTVPDNDPTLATSIEDWIARLAAHGLRVKYSSGTSGHFSFIPRDEATEQNLVNNGLAQIASMLMQHQINVASCDGFMFAFRGGHQGFATIAEKLGDLTASQKYLFDFPIDADLIRSILKGTATADQRQRFGELRAQLVEGKHELNRGMISAMKAGVANGRSAVVWGPPFQLVDVCRVLEADGETLELAEGSWLIFGGGWKSFAGERIERPALVALIRERLGIAEDHVLEGYGMTECNTLSLRCSSGRFHVPPLVWPWVVDDALYPTESARGRYAFSDPFALSYPGLLISGDSLELTRQRCECGKPGFSIRGEVERASGSELRGCAGVMASVRA